MSDLLTTHLAACQAQGLATATITQRRRAVGRFARRVGVQPVDATEPQLASWWACLTGTDAAKAVELSHVRSFCRWAAAEGHRQDDPSRALDPDNPRATPRPHVHVAHGLQGDPLPRHLDAMRLRGLTEATVQQRRRAMYRLRAANDGRDLLDLDPDEVGAYYATMLRLSAGTRATELAHLRSYCRWAMREGIIGTDPTIRLDRPRLPRRLPRPMAEDKLALAVAAASPRMRALLLLAGFAGLRCKELAGLERQHVLDGLPEPALLVADGKGGHQRLLPLHPLAVEALRALPMAPSGPVFPRTDPGGHGRPMSACRVSNIINLYLHGLGITDTAHTLRHRFATAVYRQTLDLRLTQTLLGHASPTTTAMYAAHDVSQAGAAVGRLGLSSDAA